MSKYLAFYGGDRAVEIIREHGFTQDIVKVVAGAAGGPKWLLLGALDKVLFSHWFKKRSDPLFLLGSSAGAWRFAAACGNSPEESMEKLREGYINQRYSTSPTDREIHAQCMKILDGFLDEEALDGILAHPFCRLNFLAVRSRGLTGSQNRVLQGAGLGTAVLANAVSRNRLRHFFHRVLFYHPVEKPPFYHMDRFPITRVPIDRENFKKALLSSGSIPLVMPGVQGISGAPEGVYRDGGALDYHLDIPFLDRGEDKIVLFPHYTHRIVPGWLDKGLPGRLPDKTHMDNVLLVAPTEKFTRLLPDGKIPDRNDFKAYRGRNSRRIAVWQRACKISKILEEEFMELIDSKRIPESVKPIKSA